MKSWTSTGCFSNSTGSSATNRRFSPDIAHDTPFDSGWQLKTSRAWDLEPITYCLQSHASRYTCSKLKIWDGPNHAHELYVSTLRCGLEHGHNIRHVGVIRLLFLIGHLHLIGVWLGEDQRIKHRQDTLFKKDWTAISIWSTPMYSIFNISGRTCAFI